MTALIKPNKAYRSIPPDVFDSHWRGAADELGDRADFGPTLDCDGFDAVLANRPIEIRVINSPPIRLIGRSAVVLDHEPFPVRLFQLCINVYLRGVCP